MDLYLTRDSRDGHISAHEVTPYAHEMPSWIDEARTTTTSEAKWGRVLAGDDPADFYAGKWDDADVLWTRDPDAEARARREVGEPE